MVEPPLPWHVDRDVADSFRSMRDTFLQTYRPAALRLEEGSFLIQSFSPIERILKGSFKIGFSNSSLKYAIGPSGEVAVLDVSSAGSVSVQILSSEQQVKVLPVSSISNVSAISLGLGGCVLLGSTDGSIVLFQETPVSGPIGPPLDLGSGIVLIEYLAVPLVNTFCVATAEGSIHFVHVDGGNNLSTQLLIAASPEPLGSRVVALSARRNEKNNLLAILTEKAVLIVSLADGTGKPRIVFKMTGTTEPPETGEWFQDCGDLSLLIAFGKISSGRCLVVSESPTGFEQHELSDTRSKSNLTKKTIHFFPNSNLGISVEYSYKGGSTRWTSSLFELARDNASLTYSFREFDSLIEFCGIGECILAPGRMDTANLLENKSTIVSLSSTDSRVDVHALSVSSWSDVVASLLYGEKLETALSVLRNLIVRKSLPGRSNLSQEQLHLMVRSFFQACLRQQQFFTASSATVCEFACQSGFIELLDDMVYEEPLQLQSIYLRSISALSVERRIEAKGLPSFLVQKIIKHLSDSGNIESLDKFLVQVIPSSSRDEILIDTNFAIRLATVNDLELPLILIHTNLLRDYLFPVTYLLGQTGHASFDNLWYYIFCVMHCLSYPWMEPCVEGDQIQASIIAREQIEKFLYRENGWKRVVRKTSSFGRFFGSILPNFDFFQNTLCSSTELCQDPLSIPSLLVYGTKSALEHRRLDELMRISGKSKTELLHFVFLHSAPSTEFVLKYIDEANLFANKGVHSIMNVVDQILSCDSDVLVNLLHANVSHDKLAQKEVVEFLLSRNQIHVALLFLERRKSFEELLNLMEQQVSESVENLTAFITALKEITEKDGEVLGHRIVDVWANILSRRSMEGECNAFLEKLPLDQLVPIVKHFHNTKYLLSRIYERNIVNELGKTLHAIDVGNLFNQFAHCRTRRTGTVLTPTICHMCMNALISRTNNILAFSCGHLVHQKCYDTIAVGRPDVIHRCPVCV